MTSPNPVVDLPINSPTNPMEYLFNVLWSRRAEPVIPKSVKEAVSLLRVQSKLTREEFARRLLLTTGQLTNLESFGKPLVHPTVLRLVAVAEDYKFEKISGYFKSVEMDFRVGNLRRKPK